MRVRTEEKRDAIVQAASEVFLELGFEGASMSQIAARVGGSKRTLYGYFPSKEELFVAFAKDMSDRYIDPLLDALSQSSGPVAETLQRFGEDILGFLCQPSSITIWQTIIGVSGGRTWARCSSMQAPKKACNAWPTICRRRWIAA